MHLPPGEPPATITHQSSAVRARPSQQPLVDQLVVCLQRIEADDETLVQLPKLRKISTVLDAMMLIEVLEKAVQPWDEGSLKLVCTGLPISNASTMRDTSLPSCRRLVCTCSQKAASWPKFACARQSPRG